MQIADQVQGEEEQKPVQFEWEPGVEFEIAPLLMKVRKEVLKKCEVVQWVDHQKEKTTDYEKFSRLSIEKVVVGWCGLTYEYLIEICKPLKFNKANPPKLNDPIEFSPENLKFICDHQNNKFRQFVIDALEQLDEMDTDAKKKELENLSLSSGGKTNPTA